MLERKPIRIGRRLWSGVNVTILTGVTIGDDLVITVGGVVTADVPSNCIVRVPTSPECSGPGALW